MTSISLCMLVLNGRDQQEKLWLPQNTTKIISGAVYIASVPNTPGGTSCKSIDMMVSTHTINLSK